MKHRTNMLLSIMTCFVFTLLSSLTARAQFDGAYTGGYAGTATTPQGTFPVAGPVALTVNSGAITVTSPAPGSGSISGSGSATFSGSGGALEGTYTFSGKFVVDTVSLTVTASGGWDASFSDGTPNGTGTASGTWSTSRTQNSSILITSPNGGETWAIGTTQSIKWTSSNASNVKIENSTDNGLTWSTIVASTQASSGTYSWEIPETPSTKSRVRISDASDPNTFGISGGMFTIVYMLTRKLPDGSYEPFQVATHSWLFANSLTNMWPDSWWAQQFNYSVPPYPSGWQYWPVVSQPNAFPDWLSYAWIFSNGYNVSTIWKWFSISGLWHGSCFGFAVSSFLAFDNKTGLRQKFPELPDFAQLNMLPLTDATRQVINRCWIYQLGLLQVQYRYQNYNESPQATLNDVKNMLKNQDRDDRVLSFWNSDYSAGHTVNPYKIETDPNDPTKTYIYVYDSNSPFNTEARIEVGTDNGPWSYGPLGWSGQTHFHLEQPVSTYLNGIILPAKPNLERVTDLKGSTGSDHLQMYNRPGISIRIADQVGNSIGFADSATFNSLANSMPIIPTTGSFNPPIGYYVPTGKYSITMSKFVDSLSSFFVFSDSTSFMYRRSDASSTQNDNLSVDRGIGLHNEDPKPKNVNLVAILTDDTASVKIFDFEGLQMLQNDSMSLGSLNRQTMTIVNAGASKSYNLRLTLGSGNNEQLFSHARIVIDSNSSHIVSPNWMDILRTPITIYVDKGNTGSITDTIEISNQLSDVRGPSALEIPRQYSLSQNYPNPFNPTTTIGYALPQRSSVILSVFNTLGQKIITLVQATQNTGYHEVRFDASGLASGVYFYRIEAGSFMQTRKLLLLR